MHAHCKIVDTTDMSTSQSLEMLDKCHAIHARFLRLEESMALLPPPLLRAPLSSTELHIVSQFNSI